MAYREDDDARLAQLGALRADADALRVRVAELEADNAILRAEVDRLSRVAHAALPAPVPALRRVRVEVTDAGILHTLEFTHRVITIGRAGADVELADPATATMHAVIENGRSDVVLADAGSSTGTYVGGESIKIRTLHTGDQIRIGAATIVVLW